MNTLRIYCDTSVIGGYFDKEFEHYSKLFIDSVLKDKIILIISEVVLKELSEGPSRLVELLKTLPTSNIETIEINNEIIELSNEYLKEKIISEKYRDDAIHVAAATISRADAIVSWNFKHIVRLDKIKLYNLVNLKNGFGLINIITPMEINYENEE
jgi:predicted nucleic acid-binding protein